MKTGFARIGLGVLLPLAVLLGLAALNWEGFIDPMLAFWAGLASVVILVALTIWGIGVLIVRPRTTKVPR